MERTLYPEMRALLATLSNREFLRSTCSSITWVCGAIETMEWIWILRSAVNSHTELAVAAPVCAVSFAALTMLVLLHVEPTSNGGRSAAAAPDASPPRERAFGTKLRSASDTAAPPAS